MTVFFRRAVPEDLDRLLTFMHESYAIDGLPFDPLNQRSALSGLMAHPQHGFIWLIEQDAVAVGYIVVCFGYSVKLGGRVALLEELYLIPAARDVHIEAQAIQTILMTCRANGIQAIDVEIPHENHATLADYEQSGFARRTAVRLSRVIGDT